MRRRSKYGIDLSRVGRLKRTYDGILYASQAEARYAAKLDLLRRAGKIRHWSRQARYEIGPHICLVADFVVFPNAGGVEVHEVKGMRLATWKIKEKLFRAKYPDIPLIEIDARTLQEKK